MGKFEGVIVGLWNLHFLPLIFLVVVSARRLRLSGIGGDPAVSTMVFSIPKVVFVIKLAADEDVAITEDSGSLHFMEVCIWSFSHGLEIDRAMSSCEFSSFAGFVSGKKDVFLWNRGVLFSICLSLHF